MGGRITAHDRLTAALVRANGTSGAEEWIFHGWRWLGGKRLPFGWYATDGTRSRYLGLTARAALAALASADAKR